MKKYICIFIAAVMLLSCCACGDLPDAKELMILSLENMADHDYSAVLNISLAQSGVRTQTELTVDGTKDKIGNHHAFYELAMTNVTYNGEFYYFSEDMLIYLQLMDVWMELYLADYFAGITMDELRNMFSFDIDTMLGKDDILSYSEVKKDHGNYVFDIYIEDNEQTRQLLGQELGTEDVNLSPEQYIDIICKMKFTVKVNANDNTLAAVSADFTDAFSSMKDLFGTEFTGMSFEVQYENAGKTDDVTLAEDVLENSVSMIELMYYLTSTDMQY